MKFHSQLLTFAGLLAMAGCVDDGDSAGAPPVKNALDQMQALEDANSRVKPAGATAGTLGPNQIPPAKDVPQTGEFEVEFDTTAGKFTIQVNRAWAPRGAHRFYRLVKDGFYDDAGFFRVVPNFMVQFGIAADPEVHAKWNTEIKDEPVKESNTRGYVSFAKTNTPNSRTSQIFINYKDNSKSLDPQGFSPFGKVVKGMDIVDRISSVHGESPDQMNLETEGTPYLKREFPELDYVTSAKITVDDQSPEDEE